MVKKRNRRKFGHPIFEALLVVLVVGSYVAVVRLFPPHAGKTLPMRLEETTVSDNEEAANSDGLAMLLFLERCDIDLKKNYMNAPVYKEYESAAKTFTSCFEGNHDEILMQLMGCELLQNTSRGFGTTGRKMLLLVPPVVEAMRNSTGNQQKKLQLESFLEEYRKVWPTVRTTDQAVRIAVERAWIDEMAIPGGGR